MLKNTLNHLSAFKNVTLLANAIKETLQNSIKLYSLAFKHYKIAKFFQKTFHINIEKLKESYIYMGSNHLEFSPFSGILIKDSHRLFDIFPRILALDSNQQSLNNLTLLLDSSFCPLTTQIFNYKKEELPTNYLFDSISLPLTLDRMATNLQELEFIILKLKEILNSGGMIFGFSAIKTNQPLSIEATNYIKQHNLHGLNYSAKDLDNLLYKHFDHIGMLNVGDLTLFRASISPAKKNADKQRPTLENTAGKKVIVPKDHKIQRFLDFRKPDLF